jgi:hypothetical protein
MKRRSVSFIRTMVKALSASEMFVNFYENTRHSITEDSHHHTHGRKNLKSRLPKRIFEPNMERETEN